MKIRLFGIISVILLLSSCSEYSRVQKGRDMDAKLDLAIKLYNKKQYYKALPLLEELITVYRGTQKAEKTYYYYAYTNYYLGDFEGAAYDFENFAKTYPSSVLAEECYYMHAYCYYQSSPDYNLDQTNTLKAINELQLFTDRYPGSARVEECNKLIDQLRNKLEIKAYENANMYYDIGLHKSAVTAYKNLLHDFPSTQFREEIMFRIVKSMFLLAENSLEEKKPERYEETISAYTEFISAYPDSRMKSRLENYLENSRKRLSKLNRSLFIK